MSGHSKWASIKRQKGAQDQKRGALFTKLGNSITIAARTGGDPESNFQLRLAVDRAKSANMPKSNIEKAIKRGAGEEGREQIEEGSYEGYGPGQVAIIVNVITDNKNRTTSNIRHIIEKHGGSLGQSGTVAWQFKQKGVIRLSQVTDKEELELAAIDLGADDIKREDGSLVVYTAPADLQKVKEGLEAKGQTAEYAELEQVPQNLVAIDDAGIKNKLNSLFGALDDDPDVNDFYTNLAD